MISLIACVGKNNELGKDNQLCFRLKTDMKFFKHKTWKHPVVMGRKTYESIGHPLPERINYVLTRGMGQPNGAVIILSDLDNFLSNMKDDVFVIGGASIYEQALPYADVIYLTEVDTEANADSFFPKFNKTRGNNNLLHTFKTAKHSNGFKATFGIRVIRIVYHN